MSSIFGLWSSYMLEYVGCSLCSSDQLGISLVLRGSELRSHLCCCHLPMNPFSHHQFIFCELINHIFYLCIGWFNLFYLGFWYIKDINPLACPWTKFILELGALCLFLLTFSGSITTEEWVLKMNHLEISIMLDSMTW